MGLARDNNGQLVQAGTLQATGATTNISSAAGSAATASALEAGLYRVTTDIDAYICVGATAAATDMPLWANTTEYFYINGKLAAYCSGTGGVISATKVG